jgi:predicted GIY-YIG superfamily endonuclease
MASLFPADDAIGTIYLIHFSGPTTDGRQHYLGWSSNVGKRFAQHQAGAGAHQTQRAVAEGLKLTLAQTWKGTPAQERRIKQERRHVRRGFACLCPFCDRDDALASELIRGLGPPTLRIRRIDS